MVFGRESAPGCALGVVSESRGGIAEGDSLKSRDFSIISRRANISSSCFTCIASTAAVIADVTTLAIDYLTAGSMEL